jgi:hypothetical protein
MDGGGSVHREVGDHSPVHQLDEKWRQACLDDVAAEHHDDASPLLCGGCHRLHNQQEIPRDENIGQRFEKSGKAAVRSWW